MLGNLKDYKILLASKSPRRRELMEMLRIPFKTVSIGGIDESYPKEMNPKEVPEYLAKLKAGQYLNVFHENELIITADTLVICEDTILGKPSGYEEAREMLRMLSGRTHKVVTGVGISTQTKQKVFASETEVCFGALSDDDITFYIENFHPFDKAGAYGIQEWIGCIAVEWINGSFYNVMGLPVHKLYNELKRF